MRIFGLAQAIICLSVAAYLANPVAAGGQSDVRTVVCTAESVCKLCIGDETNKCAVAPKCGKATGPDINHGFKLINGTEMQFPTDGIVVIAAKETGSFHWRNKPGGESEVLSRMFVDLASVAAGKETRFQKTSNRHIGNKPNCINHNCEKYKIRTHITSYAGICKVR